ncbi:hypothetical protein AB0L14_24990 [Streptomyces sp. NPDC052727]|uniref:hypothetical protein n=1 Tax=Streptomyces sp. NPDC052727 TaxID=3154854 RepID=UPI00343E65CE
MRLPVEDYMLSNADTAQIEDARSAVESACMQRQGFTFNPPSARDEDGVVAASGRWLAHVDKTGKKVRTLAATDGVPFDIRPTRSGLAFIDRHGDTARAKLWNGNKTAALASGPIGDVALEQGEAGRVFLTGKPHNVRLSGTPVTRLNVPADTDISSSGRLAVDPTSGRQDWPGESGYSTAGFRPAWWTNPAQRDAVKPPLDAFCNSMNNCNTSNPPKCPDAKCYEQYWWNGSNVTWKKYCDSECGHENIKYETLVAEPGRGYRLQYGTPVCTSDGLPSGALVVKSIEDNADTLSDCGSPGTDNGSFQFTFYPDLASTGPGLGQYDAKGDLYQIGGGYDGHFWYAHTATPLTWAVTAGG